MFRDSRGRSLATGLSADQCQRCGAPSMGKGSWNTRGDCQICGDPCCDACTVSDADGLVCPTCIAGICELIFDCGDVTEALS